MTAFRHLLALNIPCVWQIAPDQDKELITLELSVFWFDDKHTGIIDTSTYLKELKGNKNIYMHLYNKKRSNRL